MKKWIIVGFVLLLANAAVAQQSRANGRRLAPDERAKRSVEMLDKELILTQTQKDSIYQISLRESEEQQHLFGAAQNGNDRKARFEKIRDLREKTQVKIKEVLDGDQQKKYDALLKERQNRMDGRRGTRNF